MPRQVVVQDATIAALAARPDAVARLPHLLGALATLQPESGCSRCGAANARREAYARARQAVAACSAEDLEALKGLLGADTLVVHVAGPSGAVRAVNR